MPSIFYNYFICRNVMKWLVYCSVFCNCFKCLSKRVISQNKSYITVQPIQWFHHLLPVRRFALALFYFFLEPPPPPKSLGMGTLCVRWLVTRVHICSYSQRASTNWCSDNWTWLVLWNGGKNVALIIFTFTVPGVFFSSALWSLMS